MVWVPLCGTHSSAPPPPGKGNRERKKFFVVKDQTSGWVDRYSSREKPDTDIM